MTDPRLVKLSHTIIHYSTGLKAGDKILIEMTGPHHEFTRELIRQANAVGAQPYLWLREPLLIRELMMGATEEQLKRMAAVDSSLMEQMDAYVGVRGGDNSSQYADVPLEKQDLMMQLYSSPVHGQIRVPKTRWVVLRYPSPSMAQLANQSTEAFEDFYFDVCNLDYAKMGRAMEALVARMAKTSVVRLTGPGTDLSFSIQGMAAIPCDGKLNIPDGEIFTAPVKSSVNGTITYNTPALYQGFTFENIRFTFQDGRIVSHSSNDDERVEKILNTDEGARYVGEFAIGVNPFITRPMRDTLFDEKIAGSIHLTPGKCYDEADNGNFSALHWDLVMIQTPEYGGGEMYFDGELVRKDGRFVTEDLLCLNPENLK